MHGSDALLKSTHFAPCRRNRRTSCRPAACREPKPLRLYRLQPCIPRITPVNSVPVRSGLGGSGSRTNPTRWQACSRVCTSSLVNKIHSMGSMPSGGLVSATCATHTFVGSLNRGFPCGRSSHTCPQRIASGRSEPGGRRPLPGECQARVDPPAVDPWQPTKQPAILRLTVY